MTCSTTATYNDNASMYRGGRSHSTSTEMLASALLLCSISEDSATIPADQFQQRSASSGNIHGWGCSDTRKSYKTGLSSLAGLDQYMSSTDNQTPSSYGKSQGGDDDNFGFFMDV